MICSGLEDEFSSSTLANSLIDAAEAAVAADSFLGDVKVMNISFKNGGLAQSQLIATAPVPDPSTPILMVAGGGLLWLVRRRKVRK